jgi:hypothetical protein
MVKYPRSVWAMRLQEGGSGDRVAFLHFCRERMRPAREVPAVSWGTTLSFRIRAQKTSATVNMLTQSFPTRVFRAQPNMAPPGTKIHSMYF